MDESFFNALRIVAVMIGIDLEVRPGERKWFMGLLDQYGIPKDSLEILSGDLLGKTSVEELHRGIIHKRDRERLMKWAIFAANLDTRFHPKERELMGQIKELNRKADLMVVDDFSLAKAIAEHDRDVKFWQDLQSASQFYTQSANPGLRGFSSYINYFIRGEKLPNALVQGKAFWLLTVFVFGSIILLAIVMSLFIRQ